MLRFHRRDSFGAELALLRSHLSLRNGRAEEEIPGAVRAGRKNRLLRAYRAAGGFECGGAANEGCEEGRRVRNQWYESMDYQWRSGRRGDCVSEQGEGEGRKRYYRDSCGKRHAGFQGWQRRKETGDQRHGVQRTRFRGLRSACYKPHRE